MNPETPRRRGRPSTPTPSPLGEYLRQLREARKWTVRDLALAVGLPITSASYVSQLEAGLKVPNAELAAKLAEQLGDEAGIFALWAMTGRRSDAHRAARARRQLARLLNDPSLAHDPHFTHPGLARIEVAKESLWNRRRIGLHSEYSGDEFPASPQSSAADAPPGHGPRAHLARAEEWASLESNREPARLAASESLEGFRRVSEEPRAVRIPILPEGLDPDHPGLMEMMIGGLHRADSLRLEAGAAQALGLERPYACRLTERGVRRVTSLLQPGDLAVVTRGREPISPHEVYAVRLGGHVEFSFVMWNGHQLLLLPDEGQTDFVVLDTRKPPELERLVVGRLATVVRGAPESER